MVKEWFRVPEPHAKAANTLAWALKDTARHS
jgi:hypothetical protein